eukprot:GGOE01035476.1.p1 GENE.GGOE01035476.1~~GGOE01035476.1.p1  ORF type:complete len:1062 (+),score=255.96 GGOE01035476.1:261-3188(+)
MAKMNETGQELLQTTLDLMTQTENATAQEQVLVATLLVSFGDFVQSVIVEFEAMGTDYASRLRTESAQRAQLIFSNMLENCILAIQRPSRLFQLGMLNLTRPLDQPMDDGTCTLVGALCSASAELGVSVYVGTYTGSTSSCDVTDVADTLVVHRGAVSDNYTFFDWAPYNDSNAGANFPHWKHYCLVDTNVSSKNEICPHGFGMQYPDRCNATCGFDSRCRPWYTIHDTAEAPRTKMSDVYIDALKDEAVVTLSYPLYNSSHTLLVVGATDFYFSKVDAFLRKLSSAGNSELVAVIFNSSDLMLVGSSPTPCPNATRSSGNPVTEACDASLRGLGGWLVANRGLASNVSLELDGTLWDVFPASVDTLSYFVAVGMNKSEVYAVITAMSQAASDTLHNLSQQQSAEMAISEGNTITEMNRAMAERIADLQALENQLLLQTEEDHVATDSTINMARRESADKLSNLTTREMLAISQLEDYHLSQMSKNIGVTFGALVGIFAGILLLGLYGTWAITKQVQRIAEVMEDLAHMRVEALEVSQKSSIGLGRPVSPRPREVQRMEDALVVLVQRLAEYKSYMPAGLFQEENVAPQEEPIPSPSTLLPMVRKQSLFSPRSCTSPRHTRVLLSTTSPSSCRSSTVRSAPVASCARLSRRTAAVMVVNVIRFQADVVNRQAGQVETLLNRFIAVVHSVVSKAQGNVDAVVGDQVLVTFNAHFACSDPSTAASSVALDVMEILKEDSSFPWCLQIGLATGPMYTGHLGYSSFKSMLALGAPMKVASLLAHLSGFDESVVLACPSVEERIKYSFVLQPADLVALPTLGEHIPFYAKSITVFVLVAHECHSSGSQEWLYEVGADGCDEWRSRFTEVIKPHPWSKCWTTSSAMQTRIRRTGLLCASSAAWQCGSPRWASCWQSGPMYSDLWRPLSWLPAPNSLSATCRMTDGDRLDRSSLQFRGSVAPCILSSPQGLMSRPLTLLGLE